MFVCVQSKHNIKGDCKLIWFRRHVIATPLHLDGNTCGCPLRTSLTMLVQMGIMAFVALLERKFEVMLCWEYDK